VFEPIDLVKIEKRMRKHGIKNQEFSVFLGKKKKIECRLIVECLPLEVRAEKLRRAKRAAQREGRTLGKDTLSRIGLNLFVTNMTQRDLPIEHVWPLYRLRWQIELVFKVFKSVVGINKIKKVKRFRFECYLYGKLLWALLGWDVYRKITQSIPGTAKTISINKIMKSFRRFCWRIIIINKKTLKQITGKLERFIENVFDNCMLEKRKGKLSSMKIIEGLCQI
jgi:IS4 transposase